MYRAILRRSLATLTRINKDGRMMNVEIRPSYAHKPKAVENLMKGLPELIGNTAGSSESTDSSHTPTWRLDGSGDTIHRHVLLRSKDEVPAVLEQIAAASRDLNHDPHTHVNGTQLTISCTTHVPPGLSMNDVKLARKVNEILKGALPVGSDGLHSEKSIPLEQLESAERENMAAIKKAKEDCSCG